jgi:hypothetical protein
MLNRGRNQRGEVSMSQCNFDYCNNIAEWKVAAAGHEDNPLCPAAESRF